MPASISNSRLTNVPAYSGTGSLRSSSIRYPEPFTPAPRLRANEVHIWTLRDCPVDISEYTSLLSHEELNRASRFRFTHLFDRFAADHGRLRLLLAAYLETSPREILFAENSHGKPRLLEPACRLRFNMSHTDGLTMVALCLDAELGIDVEAVRDIADRESIAAMHFSQPENAALDAEPEHEKTAAFFRCWTRKEAFIKANGAGLSIPLDTFAVTLSSHEQAALLYCTWDARESSRWDLIHLDPAPGYIGALAIEGREWATSHFGWPQAA
jgi:4'-phosphopantetheinyl transferase